MIAKKLGLPYLPGSRDGVVKVKPYKTADCVVAGVRFKEGGRKTIATLLLGLYADDGHLDYVGSAAVGAKRHDEIAALVLPLLDTKSDRHFSEPNRWGTGELEEQALKPKLVVEVRFDKLEKHRFRHGTKLVRFRPDKDPDQCTWREVRPPRKPGDLSVEQLLVWQRAVPGAASRRQLPSSPSLGCTRFGSPGIFGKFGGYGASPTPSFSSRSTHSSSTRRSHTASSIPVVQIAELREARRHRRDREVLHLDVGQLVPAHRRRHRCIRPSAHRVRGEDRAVARVLVVVDEHALAALLLPPRGRDELRRAPLDLARERERAAAHDGELPVRLDAAVDVHAAVAARLRPADVADLVEHLVHDRRRPASPRRTRARLRVDVDAQLVGLLGVARAATATRRTRASRDSPPTTTCASSVTHSSSACRPDGNVTRAVSIQSGRRSGTRFCQITSPPTPSGCRFSWHGRSRARARCRRRR